MSNEININDQTAEVKIKSITHCFGEHEVLSNINLSIEKGEIIGLLGPSGAGKTTLVSILTGQLKQTDGEVFIQGKKVEYGKLDLSKIGIMMDNWGVYERLSVQDNLKFYAKLYGVSNEKIDEVLEQTGLLDAKKTSCSDLSKGMKSRVNLCRALLKDISFLFLDEPTSGLDPATSKMIHELIVEQKKKGTTIFLTTHNMTEAEELCDHVALLNQGVIVEYGAPADICKKYNHLNTLIIQQKNGEMIELANAPKNAERVCLMMQADDILTIHSSEPNLEKVFLECTGRGLE